MRPVNETDQSPIPRGELLKQISNAMVGIKKNLYGKGPTKAKTFINDNFVFVVLEGGLTQNEITLLEAGEQDLVRSYRLRFQEVVSEQATGAVEELTGRKVIGYHSQIVFEPEFAFEILAARSFDMPFLRSPSYCLSFLTLGPWSLAIAEPPQYDFGRPSECSAT